MAAAILDASAALSALVPNQSTDAAKAFFLDLPETLIAPSLFKLEVRAALVKLERRGAIPSGHGDTGLKLLESVMTFGGALSDSAVQSASDLARSSGLSVYDAVYLDLARANGAALATRDSGLIHAASGMGVHVSDLR